MFKPLVVLSALVIGSASLAHADTINGYFSVFGADSFTPTTITFGPATVQPAIGGSLATYIKAGDPVTFLPGALPYHTGTQIPPNPPFPGNVAPIFTVAGFSGETFTFNMTSYNATYDTTSSACNAGQVCLDLTVNGYMTATGPFNLGTSGPAMGTTTLQYVSIALEGGQTTFSGQVIVSNATPEPSSLALLGTGMLGVFGFARRKFNV